ncbi:PqiC family protein [Pseudoalteromonas luteoviolacea]|uniref:ABC-type transport auxiliary lipoprotein component domain-containing protein n=1 Tax=Pseudoalteromonas luteoviolacea S4054 TaxID=1129367 RepID=A0A0F6A6K7_9GAMM|nr:PqiC family protein [Pseudoalteromonas luteoviolacea]AOT10520.1 hypothetical protein S4054249_21890 [Pseudoalteromonas luteoviolacea]AOT15412.1 hypothetical protein S40542_21705 [Pseudoalteromonas luteoviolacea]AOT20339.1 hypothetical protein S4054_21805 [Pseudoalteromonas luteoviolacea]KKE81471.1 hypothetical protein N479_03025 [Pseudoalteromonas luteoviolacea S4054]KZN71632.1 hypothetical protein N481_18355 [Pseudoalteromonas luteoviolacea S4047-1]
MRLAIQACLLSLILVGCSSNTINHQYYKFSELHNDAPLKHESNTQVIYLEDVSLLGVANQQAIVQYTQSNVVNIASFHFWAEHPETMLTQLTQNYLSKQGLTVVPRDLSGDLETNRYSLKFVVNEFAGHYEKGAVLNGSWYLYELGNSVNRLVQSKRFAIDSQLKSDGFNALVAAHQHNWEKLLKDIESELVKRLNRDHK